MTGGSVDRLLTDEDYTGGVPSMEEIKEEYVVQEEGGSDELVDGNVNPAQDPANLRREAEVYSNQGGPGTYVPSETRFEK